MPGATHRIESLTGAAAEFSHLRYEHTARRRAVRGGLCAYRKLPPASGRSCPLIGRREVRTRQPAGRQEPASWTSGAR